MKKSLALLGLTGLLTLGSLTTAFAGQWQSDANGWWWQEDNGNYPVATWQWIDGNKDGKAECYYFNNAGYMLANTTTPDGYTVNGDGAWVVNGVVQTQTVDAESSSVVPQEVYEVINAKYLDLLGKSKEEVGAVLGNGRCEEDTLWKSLFPDEIHENVYYDNGYLVSFENGKAQFMIGKATEMLVNPRSVNIRRMSEILNVDPEYYAPEDKSLSELTSYTWSTLLDFEKPQRYTIDYTPGLDMLSVAYY